MEILHLSLGAQVTTVTSDTEALAHIDAPTSPQGLYILVDSDGEGDLFAFIVKHGNRKLSLDRSKIFPP